MNETPASPLDREAFQKVWQRVMPRDRADCPFTLEPPAPAALPAPLEQRVPLCLGEDSRPEVPGLTRFLSETLALERTYRALARRSQGRQDRLPQRLAEEKRRQAQKLAAAGFLITGLPPRPDPVGSPGPEGLSVPLALRACYQAEQRLAAGLLSAAGEARDPCLIALYRELGAQDQAFAGQIREDLETVFLTGGTARRGSPPRG